MSEIDDELRRMTESPEERMRRIHEADRKAAAKQERMAALQRRYKLPLTIAGSVLGIGAVVGGMAWGFHELNEGSDEATHQNQLRFGTAYDMTSVEVLRAHGACAPELQAEATIFRTTAKLREGHYVIDDQKAAAARFERAAELAMKYHVSCKPTDVSAENLTVDFDVTALQQNHDCADELQAKAATQDPSLARNELNIQTITLQREIFELQAGLAEQFDISC